MAKRTTFIVASFVILSLCLFLWQRPTSGQAESTVAPAAGNNPRGFPVGGECEVYLRGDATGTSSQNRVVDLSSLVSIKGTLESGGDHWIILKSDDGRRNWFPVDAVAAVVAEK